MAAVDNACRTREMVAACLTSAPAARTSPVMSDVACCTLAVTCGATVEPMAWPTVVKTLAMISLPPERSFSDTAARRQRSPSFQGGTLNTAGAEVWLAQHPERPCSRRTYRAGARPPQARGAVVSFSSASPFRNRLVRDVSREAQQRDARRAGREFDVEVSLLCRGDLRRHAAG